MKGGYPIPIIESTDFVPPRSWYLTSNSLEHWVAGVGFYADEFLLEHEESRDIWRGIFVPACANGMDCVVSRPWLQGTRCEGGHGRAREGGTMLTVTKAAKEKLTSRLLRLKTGSKRTIRLIPAPRKPGKWKMIWDKERPKDQVVESEDGIKILLVGADLVRAIEGMVVDFRKTPEGTGFAIYKLRSNP